jgi:formyltetrahydrofolate-dependent phosphoribosylglycinamide formyltransferase
LQALIDAQGTPALPNAQIVLVLSNRKAAFGLQRAANAGIPTAYLAMQPYIKANPGATRDDYDGQVAKIVLEARPDLVVLAGWMHVVGPRFLDALSAAKVEAINLHPALPGAFDGVDAIKRAHAAFGRGEIEKAGVMVHRVVAEVDRGAPVLVKEIDMTTGEELEVFEERVHKTEWEVIVRATAMVLEELSTKWETGEVKQY